MDLKVLAQPYRQAEAAGQTFITNALADRSVTEVLVITAWVRRSGLALLVPGLESLRKRHGRAQMLFGVDLQGTSQQGVALARKHFGELHAVHDPSGRTFHPKMYLAIGKGVGYALIGSNNLTAGGLWHNYETAVLATFDPARESEISEGMQGYASRLLEDKAICKRVTKRVYDQLVADGWLADEETDRRRRNEDRLTRRVKSPRSDPPLFTPSQVEKRSRPAPLPSSEPRRQVSSATRRRLATTPDSWWKPLGAGDAQRPAVGNPTGNVALTHVPQGHDRETFFRRIFFRAERWRRSRDARGFRNWRTSRLRSRSAMIEWAATD